MEKVISPTHLVTVIVNTLYCRILYFATRKLFLFMHSGLRKLYKCSCNWYLQCVLIASTRTWILLKTFIKSLQPLYNHVNKSKLINEYHLRDFCKVIINCCFLFSFCIVHGTGCKRIWSHVISSGSSVCRLISR